MVVSKYRHPVWFFGLSIGIPWLLWVIAASISHLSPATRLHTILVSILGVVGLAGPMIVAGVLFLRDPELRSDLVRRFFHGASKPVYLVVTGLLMPSSILIAQGISLLFGYSPEQFVVTGNFSFSAGVYPAWFILLLAPVLEELAWHTYGTDSLRRRLNVLSTSLVFAVYWALWHVPLGFIKGYFQSNLVAEGWLYSFNFAVSIIPFVLLMNWLYFRTGRNIMVAIVFHITANLSNELFATHPDSKVIQTVVLLIVSIVVVLKERKLFFDRELNLELAARRQAA